MIKINIKTKNFKMTSYEMTKYFKMNHLYTTVK